ncbi:hypothetical protein HYQ45_009962 [Verticillium longisporum]|uniref:Uncharacterized protein n=1 Tax=Verticillium longisporum TaxID=100787 RepID=A0A0G4MR28_VERLO|nr:hypothetical protein HYQ44_004441 [Verticillium longisporum]KAG7131465.1 hypothetical protein HYQ45_009962 [Verticillium longisporum]KAG7152380.1 hypothetical protein HYQ46_011777 [Verticillium longisporum]CRK36555.1 hypothetical protein BN1723_015101 [Verticillium longisporum]CRK40005.1 hypothetical protein BN1708_008096 [Verticillium longisporum]
MELQPSPSSPPETQLSFRAYNQLTLTRNPIALSDIVKHFNNNGIPCVAWGGSALDHYGIRGSSTTIPGHHIVVPDDVAEEAKEVLLTHPFLRPCPPEDDGGCPDGGYQDKNPTLLAHRHYGRGPYTLMMSRQSDVLWALPPIPREFAKPRGLTLPDEYIFTYDKSALPAPVHSSSGGWQSQEIHPVIIPRFHCYVESVMRVLARHMGFQSSSHAALAFELSAHALDLGRNDAKLMNPVFYDLWVKAYRIEGRDLLPLYHELTVALGEVWDLNRPDF